MLLLFLPFILFSLCFSRENLIEHFECGADKWSKALGEMAVSPCPQVIQDHANLCCKVHNNCYDHHHRTGVSQDLCDIQFCICLQDAADKAKSDICEPVTTQACALVQTMRNVFPAATPPDHSKDYINFPDYKPLSMNFQSILDSCPYNQRIVVHCHNTAHKCIMKPHEQEDGEMEYDRSFYLISRSHQDCRATMYDCLRYVLATSHDEQCTSTVLREREKVNIYKKITDDGDSINIAYPIVASRMLERCPDLYHDLHICYKNFYECDVGTKKVRDERYAYEMRKACDNNLIYCKHPTDITEHPEYNFYDEVRRINITCHRELTACLQNNANAKFEVIRKSDLCLQAIAMAVNRIRTKEYAPVTSYPKNPAIQAFFWPFIKFFKIDV